MHMENFFLLTNIDLFLKINSDWHLLWTSGDICLEFQSRGGSPLFAWLVTCTGQIPQIDFGVEWSSDSLLVLMVL